MDPTTNLALQRALAKQIVTEAAQPHDYRDNVTQCLCAHATELVELVEALDDWISKGGFMPDQWQRGPFDLTDTGVLGIIQLADGTQSRFAIHGDGTSLQWGAPKERLGRTVDLVSDLRDAFWEQEG